MVSESARTLELLRQRDRQKRSMQLWVGLVIVWAAVLGWLAFLAVRALTPDTGSLWAWLAYLVPLAVVGGIALMHAKSLRDIDSDLLASTEADRRH